MVQARKIRPPFGKKAAPKPEPPPTLDSMLSQFQQAMHLQLNTVVAQFLDGHTDDDIDAFLPEDIEEADTWVEQHIAKFTENENPSIKDMTDGLGAIFMMAFLEQLYEHCQVEEDDEESEDESDDGDSED